MILKKVLGIVMVLMMVIGLMVPVFSSAESVSGHASMYVYCANGKRLNLREAPLSNATILTRLDNGTKVTILEDAGDGWAMVSCNGRKGFVRTEFLQSKAPAAAKKSTFKSFSAKVYSPNGKKCNLRVAADDLAFVGLDGLRHLGAGSFTVMVGGEYLKINCTETAVW